jgi:hypothetical protein
MDVTILEKQDAFIVSVRGRGNCSRTDVSNTYTNSSNPYPELSMYVPKLICQTHALFYEDIVDAAF